MHLARAEQRFAPPPIAPSQRARAAAMPCLECRAIEGTVPSSPLENPMKTIATATLPRIALAAALLAGAAAAHAFELRVEVLNAKPQGVVNAALYTEAGWLKPDQVLRGAREAAAAEGKTVLVYRDVPAGAYAVSLFQDENGNGKFDRNPAGIPTERYGFSRDAMGRMGPPAFADARLELSADTAVTVTLR